MSQLPPSPWKRAALFAVARAEHAVRKKSISSQSDLRQIRNFLFLQYDAPLGSVVHATPLFEMLKAVMPEAHVVVAASPMAAGVLNANPFIDRLVVTANPFTRFHRAAIAVRNLLHTLPGGPSCVVTTIGNQRTRLAMLSVLAGSAIRAGYTLAPELYDVPLIFMPEEGQIAGNLGVLRALAHEAAFCEPHMFFSDEDANYATELLNPVGRPDRPRIALITQNSGGQPNRWSDERFRLVIATLHKTYGAEPVFIGTASDAAAIEALRQGLPNTGISVAGKTTISQLAAVLAQCDLTISLDTGPFHVARAVGLPGVAIAPAWQSPHEWLPVGNPRYRVLRGPSLLTTPANYWIEEVRVDQVSAAVSDLLNRFPASAAQRTARVQNCLSRMG